MSSVMNMIKLTCVSCACMAIATSFADPPLLQNTNASPYSSWASRLNPKNADILIQMGGFIASQGKSQTIGINGLIGDQFSVNNSHGENGLLGFGYFIDGLDKPAFSLLFGVDAFYLAHTTVEGNITQEQIFTNLSYAYDLTNWPIYADTRALINTWSDRYTITFDVGLGPNIIATNNFSETSLDGTLPDHAFAAETSAAFSVTTGIGFKFNKLIPHVPLELDYRFFYLGQGTLRNVNDQYLDTLTTGNNYANTLMLSINF